MPETTPSAHFPLNEARALIHAALVRDTDEIDRITDELARQGVCRPRADMSRMAEWILLRPSDAKPIEGAEALIAKATVGDIGAQMAAHFRGIFVGAAQ